MRTRGEREREAFSSFNMALFRTQFEGALEEAKKDITIHNDDNFSRIFPRHFFVIKSPKKIKVDNKSFKSSLNKNEVSHNLN